MRSATTALVHVQGQPFASPTSAPSVMVEIRGPERQLVDRRMVAVNRGPVEMRLAGDGPHEARAILASGRVHYQDVDLGAGRVKRPDIFFNLSTESPHESLQRTAIVHRLDTMRVGDLTAPRFMSAWIQLWQRTPQGWAASSPELELKPCSWDQDAVCLILRLRPRYYLLQVGGPQLPSMLVALPGMGNTEVVLRPMSGPAGDYVEVSVTPSSAAAATLLGYMTSGSVTAVDSMLESDRLVRRLVDGKDGYEWRIGASAPPDSVLAEQVLYHKLNDPHTAALGGYHLLRTGDLERLHSWPANLSNWMEWLPDGPIIRGWQLLRGGKPQAGETPRDRFLQAASRGIPCYAEGLRLLIDGLKVVERDRREDEEVRAAIEHLGAYAAATDWTRAVLTFTGDSPNTPTTHPGTERRSHHAGTLMLHSMTVEDLVDRGLLQPGETLQANPRPTRSVEAAFANEVTVSNDGLLRWGPWSFSGPNEALVKTQDDLEDGWWAWTAESGQTLYELRRQARQKPPVPGSDDAAAFLAELDVSTAVSKRLTAAGVRSLADLLAMGTDRIADVAQMTRPAAARLLTGVLQPDPEVQGMVSPTTRLVLPASASWLSADLTVASGRRSGRPVSKKAAVKQAAAQKAVAKKAAAKKAAAKKTAAKKTAAKKVPARKAVAKKTAAKKTAAKKVPARKAVAKKTPAKKSPVKRAAAKKS